MEDLQGLLLSGSGLGEVLSRAVGNIGTALDATGVGIWRAGADNPEAEWGQELPSRETVRAAEDDGVLSSAGPLRGLAEDREIAWIVAPVRRRDRTLGVIGVVWDPPRRMAQARRDLLGSLSILMGITMENAELLERLAEKEASLQGLLRKTLSAQEEERRRIARELHDETSQVLSALMMNADLLETQLDSQPDADGSRNRVEAVKALAEQAATNIDRMMLDLRPALLDELGLIPALRWYCAQAGDLWGVEVEFQGERIERLPEHLEVAAFRIVQEAVSNVVRHAKAAKAWVRLSVGEGALRIQVADDGVGFDAVEASSRARTGEAVGLMGMRERAELAGGSFSVESTPGHGTTVSALIPVPAPAPSPGREGVDV
jgi:signal transduction histidine kinase